MIAFVRIDKISRKVLGYGYCPDEDTFRIQPVGSNEDLIIAPEGFVIGVTTHIINGDPTTISPSTEELLDKIRAIRNCKLVSTDWTQLPDSPVDRLAWSIYRQALRDMPATCDPNNPIWPTPPT